MLCIVVTVATYYVARELKLELNRDDVAPVVLLIMIDINADGDVLNLGITTNDDLLLFLGINNDVLFLGINGGDVLNLGINGDVLFIGIFNDNNLGIGINGDVLTLGIIGELLNLDSLGNLGINVDVLFLDGEVLNDDDLSIAIAIALPSTRR